MTKRMSIVEKMAFTMFCNDHNLMHDHKRHWQNAGEQKRWLYLERAKAALTATGLTEAQLEGLARGTMVIVPNPLRARNRADVVMDRAMLAAKEG